MKRPVAADVAHAHRAAAAAEHRTRRGGHTLTAAVITASDTRTEVDDAGGALLVRGLEAAGVRVVDRRIAKDERSALESALRAALATGADAVLITGGTGLSPRDVTPEVVRTVCAREVPGFGELFRMLSFDEVGAAAALSRALAATFDRQIVFALPGSPAACRLALDRLILPELSHLNAQLSPREETAKRRP